MISGHRPAFDADRTLTCLIPPRTIRSLPGSDPPEPSGFQLLQAHPAPFALSLKKGCASHLQTAIDSPTASTGSARTVGFNPASDLDQSLTRRRSTPQPFALSLSKGCITPLDIPVEGATASAGSARTVGVEPASDLDQSLTRRRSTPQPFALSLSKGCITPLDIPVEGATASAGSARTVGFDCG